MMYWNHDRQFVFWQAGLMWWAMLAFLGLALWAVYVSTRGSRRGAAGSGSAAGILDQRLARGEIDIDEWRRLHELITSDKRTSGSGRT